HSGLFRLKQTEELHPDRLISALNERQNPLPFDRLIRFRSKGLAVENGIKAHQGLTGKLPIENLTPADLVFEEALSPSRRYLALKRAIPRAKLDLRHR